MKERILSLDLARGFTVAFITPIHCMLLFSSPAVHESWLGAIFKFIAEGPGAQLFMMLMGISFVLNTHRNTGNVLTRSFQILMLGYVLNFFKFGIPFLFGLVPGELLRYMEVENDVTGFFQLVLTGDILQLAGLSLFVLLVCRKLFAYRFLYFVLAVIICFVSPQLWDYTSDHFILNEVAQLTGGQPPRVFFPLFPWLVYPVFGMYVGTLIKGGVKIKLPRLWKGTILITTIAMLIYYYFHSNNEGSFYRTSPSDTIFHLMVVMAWLYAWQLISKWVPDNRLFELLRWLSKHITLIYFVQWLLIFWLLPLFGFQELNFWWSVLVMGLVTTNVWGLVYIINSIRGK